VIILESYPLAAQACFLDVDGAQKAVLNEGIGSISRK
jgi:hypothetical protein